MSNKVKDEAASNYINENNEQGYIAECIAWAYQAAWDECLRSEPRVLALESALRGIIEIGKRDTSNPKYDSYYISAREALAAFKEGK